MTAFTAAITQNQADRKARQRDYIQSSAPPRLARFDAYVTDAPEGEGPFYLTLRLPDEVAAMLARLFNAGTLYEGQVVRALLYEVRDE